MDFEWALKPFVNKGLEKISHSPSKCLPVRYHQVCKFISLYEQIRVVENSLVSSIACTLCYELMKEIILVRQATNPAKNDKLKSTPSSRVIVEPCASPRIIFNKASFPYRDPPRNIWPSSAHDPLKSLEFCAYNPLLE